ncbi:hypothetical protein V6N12_057974 [Hibiscus sabdariffa]|uniref:Uncharacterized protein n=1 Tax=Hibiscus sabdariffa TaxID=183260 RepID=A0ABR2AEJ5_9ROSI
MARSALKGLNPQSLHPRVHLTPTKREFIDQAEAFYSRPNGGEERKSKLSYSKKPCAQITRDRTSPTSMVTGFEDLDGGEDKSTQEYTALTSSSDK